MSLVFVTQFSKGKLFETEHFFLIIPESFNQQNAQLESAELANS